MRRRWAVALAGLVACGCGPSREVRETPAVSGVAEPAVGSAATLRDPWAFGDAAGWVLRTPTHTVFTTVTDRALERRLVPLASEALAHQRSAVVGLPMPESPLRLYVLANRPQWTTMTARLMGERAGRYLQIDRGGFAARGVAVLFDIGPRDTMALLAHEHWHVYTQTVFKQPLPTWLEEGLGTYFEGFVADRGRASGVLFAPWANVERFDQLRDAEAAGELMWLPELLVTSPGEALASGQEATLGYYAQVWALVHFLMEHDGGRHRAALARVLAESASGEPRRARGAVELFTTEFDADLVRAQEEYYAFVREVVRVGAKDRIVRGESPIR